MSDNKLTPRQNELISETLCRIAVRICLAPRAPEMLKTLRRALVNELEEVTTETSLQSVLGGVRSIDG